MIFLIVLVSYLGLVSAQMTNPFQSMKSSMTQFSDAVRNLGDCLLDWETYDDHLGPISRNESYFCTPQTQRALPGLFCCTPQNSEKIRLLVSRNTPSGVIEEEVKFWDEKGAEMLSEEKKIVYLAHGFMETIGSSQWVNKTRDGYLRRGASVVVVDWGHLNQIQYFQAISNLRTVGRVIGHSILQWGVLDRTLVVGFSLGGQIVAEAGKYVKKNSNGRQIPECHGLDPAGPFFDPIYGFLPDMELDKSDCKVVQVVHSSASYSPSLSVETTLLLRLGTAFKSGHCDFWINCGHQQGPACKGDLDFVTLIQTLGEKKKNNDSEPSGGFICSHARSSLMYADAVAKSCDSNPVASVCEDCGPTEPNPLNPKEECTARPDLGTEAFPPDNFCSSDDDVNFVVYSTDSAPFCQGSKD